MHETVVPVTGERADVVVVTDLTWLFEIKSGRDSLRRLDRQTQAFARVGDRCVLVAAHSHISRAVDAVPRWWGIVKASDGPTVSLSWHREASANPGVDRRSLLLMLRKDEAAKALAALDSGICIGRRRMSLLAELDRRLDDAAVAECVRAALVRRL